MKKHTPGPWRKERNSGGHYVYTYRIRRENEDGSVRDIGECWHLEDARLIAAAPELLEMLTRALTIIDTAERTYGWAWEAKHEADALLARIEGEP